MMNNSNTINNNPNSKNDYNNNNSNNNSNNSNNNNNSNNSYYNNSNNSNNIRCLQIDLGYNHTTTVESASSLWIESSSQAVCCNKRVYCTRCKAR
jgi:hypothetical protein